MPERSSAPPGEAILAFAAGMKRDGASGRKAASAKPRGLRPPKTRPAAPPPPAPAPAPASRPPARPRPGRRSPRSGEQAVLNPRAAHPSSPYVCE
jgi:hypothetical protein